MLVAGLFLRLNRRAAARGLGADSPQLVAILDEMNPAGQP
jgi:hypothetical protein